MFKSFLSLTIVAFVFASVASADCDCTITPFKPDPPCFEKCSAKILSLANRNQLTLIFGFSPVLADRIIAVPGRSDATSLAPYRVALSPEEVLKIELTFKTIQQRQLDRLYKGNQ